MNAECGARSAPAEFGGFYGEFRLMHRAVWQRLRSREGTDEIYDTDFQAETMAWRHFFRTMFPLIRGEAGERSDVRAAAERLFAKPSKLPEAA